MIPGLLVHLLVETGVIVGVRYVDDVAGSENGASNTKMTRETDLVDLISLGHLGPQVPGLAVIEEQGTPVGLQYVRGGIHDLFQEW